MNNYKGYIEQMMRAPAQNFSKSKSAQKFLNNQTLAEKEYVPECTILLVEDDWDDYFFAKDSCEASDLVKEVVLMPNGEELIYYLKEKGSMTIVSFAITLYLSFWICKCLK